MFLRAIVIACLAIAFSVEAYLLFHPSVWRRPPSPLPPLTAEFIRKNPSGAIQLEIDEGLYSQATQSISGNLHTMQSDANPFMKSIVRIQDHSFLDSLNRWVKAEPDAALPYLLRGYYYYKTGWAVRGRGLVNTVKPEAMATYGNDLNLALKDVLQSIQLDQDIPYSYWLALAVTGESQNREVQNKVFAAGIARFPDYYNLYTLQLRFLTPKWGGSVKNMVEFTFYYAGKAQEHSPLKMLYIDLYYDLVSDYQIDCSGYTSDAVKQQCTMAMDKLLDSQEMRHGVRQALALYDPADPYRFNALMMDRVNCCNIASQHNKAFLDLAQSVLGPDNYAVNYGLLLYYAYSKQSADMAKALNKTVALLKAATFPDQEIKTEWLINAYTIAADGARWQGDSAATQSYMAAQTELRHPTHDEDYYAMQCSAQSNAQDWPDAVENCGKAITLHDQKPHTGGRPYMQFLRGQAYFQLNELTFAKKDLEAYIYSFPPRQAREPVAEMAIRALTEVYFAQKSPQNVIQLYNNLPLLLEASGGADAADHYARRCRAYMAIGDYDKALLDCGSSMKLHPTSSVEATREEVIERMHAGNKI